MAYMVERVGGRDVRASCPVRGMGRNGWCHSGCPHLGRMGKLMDGVFICWNNIPSDLDSPIPALRKEESGEA